MNKEMRFAYRPNQEHEYDPTDHPRDEQEGDNWTQEHKLDNLIDHQTEGSDVVVYCLPREHTNSSRRYIDLLNHFSKIGGLKILLGFINHKNVDKFALTLVYQMIRLVALPWKLYHSTYLRQWGVGFATRVKDLVLLQPLEQLKKLSNEQLDMFSNIVKDIMTQASCKEDSYEPRLQICKKYLESEALTLRRYSIKELNNVLQQASYSTSSSIIES